MASSHPGRLVRQTCLVCIRGPGQICNYDSVARQAMLWSDLSIGMTCSLNSARR